MKIWKIAVVTTLVVALVLGVAPPGLADSNEAATADEGWGKRFPRIIRGEVIDIGVSSFDISRGENSSTTYVTDDTKFLIVSVPIMAMHQWRSYPEQANIPPPMSAMPKSQFGSPRLRMGKANGEPAAFMLQRPEFAPNLLQFNNGQGMVQRIRARLAQLRHLCEEASFSDLDIGDKVAALLTPASVDSLTGESEEGLTAQVVFIIKPTAYARVTGTISDIDSLAKTITIEPADGSEAVTLDYDERTIFTLMGITEVEAEQFACAGYNAETMMAKVVRVWPEAPPIPLPAE